jgi:hypothetical protein
LRGIIAATNRAMSCSKPSGNGLSCEVPLNRVADRTTSRHGGRLKPLVLSAIVVAAGAAGAQPAAPYVQTNLASDIPGLATITDPLLVNPWGMSRSATSPFWISNQGSNSSTLYRVTGSTDVTRVDIAPNGFVAIPTTAGGPQGPTGQVNNGNTASFQLTPGDAATSSRFIFAT